MKKEDEYKEIFLAEALDHHEELNPADHRPGEEAHRRIGHQRHLSDYPHLERKCCWHGL